MIYKNNMTYPNDKDKQSETCMIIAFPTDADDREVCLFDKESLEKFVNFTIKTSDDIVDFDYKLQALGISYNYANVKKVGNYSISIVKSLKDLNTKIHPMFKSASYENNIKIFSDSNLFPENITWSYLVAKTSLNITNDYFGIVYKNTSKLNYFPTCHESADNEMKDYDVNIHYWSNTKTIFPFNMSNNYVRDVHTNKLDLCQYDKTRGITTGMIYAPNQKTLATFHTKANIQHNIKGVSYDTNKKMDLNITGDFFLSTTYIKCSAKNQNIIFPYQSTKTTTV